MEPSIILAVIVGIVLLSYVLDQVLDFINLKNQREDIPDEVAAFYDKEKYAKSLAYHRELARFSFITSAFSVILAVTMLLTGGFGWLDNLLRNHIQHDVALALVFFGVILIASDIITLPLQWYSTFVIEERYGFNKTTGRTFILDKIKGWLLGAIIGGALLVVLIYLVNGMGSLFWVWFALVTAAFMLLMNMFYTSLILPLFNKLTPLPDGELKTAIQTYAQQVDFPLDNIFIIDGSKRSAKANAFFSGIGKKKKIVLYDTLINNHTIDELVAVLAHEVGHFKKKHIVLSYILSVLNVVFILYVLSLMIFNENLSLALGGTQQAIHLNLIAFSILISPISGVVGIIMNVISRKNEFEADAFAITTYKADAMMSALKKLSVDNLSDLYPHPWYVFFHYSHPPLLKRLAAMAATIKIT